MHCWLLCDVKMVKAFEERCKRYFIHDSLYKLCALSDLWTWEQFSPRFFCFSAYHLKTAASIIPCMVKTNDPVTYLILVELQLECAQPSKGISILNIQSEKTFSGWTETLKCVCVCVWFWDPGFEEHLLYFPGNSNRSYGLPSLYLLYWRLQWRQWTLKKKKKRKQLFPLLK